MLSQIQFISKVLNTKDYSIIASNDLNDKYFYNFQSEFNFIKNHYDTYRCVPDIQTFKSIFPNFSYIQDVSEPYSYLMEQLYKDYNKAYLAITFNNIKSLIENNNIDAAVDKVLVAMDGLHTGAVMTCTNLLTDTTRYDRYLERTMNSNDFYVSTGFKELDAIIKGLDRKNENLVIAARTGIGKTQTLIKMAVEACVSGLNVGIYEGEMTADKVGYRFDTFLGHISNSSLNHGDLYVQKEYKNYLDSLKTMNCGSIKVLTPNDVPGNVVNVNTLRSFVEREKLDILFVDQYSLMEDIHNARTSFERVGNIAKDIKKLQVEKQIPIVAVAQMNRTKNEDGSKDSTQIGLSDLIPQYATILLMLDRKDDMLSIDIVKARDGGDGRTLNYKVNWNTGEFNFVGGDDGAENPYAKDMQSMKDRYSKTEDEEITSWQ